MTLPLNVRASPWLRTGACIAVIMFALLHTLLVWHILQSYLNRGWRSTSFKGKHFLFGKRVEYWFSPLVFNKHTMQSTCENVIKILSRFSDTNNTFYIIFQELLVLTEFLSFFLFFFLSLSFFFLARVVGLHWLVHKPMGTLLWK